ncbi:hypothetical protein EYC80_001851 [Monilinia laxa]|uniref:Uncharacterized protein n=1 Tax=Monilinia laxa TaxID=61186 RepID=A0A5N6K689_MONLA|nr:hypothetical protein EYC80_001851 [Monilinia laxa]
MRLKIENIVHSSCAFCSRVNPYLAKSHSSTHAMILHSLLLHTTRAPNCPLHPALQSPHRPKNPCSHLTPLVCHGNISGEKLVHNQMQNQMHLCVAHRAIASGKYKSQDSEQIFSTPQGEKSKG